jgi:lipopolysaccharide/colanic/teichoic acid biosynthesis glycosyltransferase
MHVSTLQIEHNCEHIYCRVFKRCFDLVFAAVGLVLLSPFMFAAAVLIYISSPGPVLYRGWRVGLFGQPFRILKFRTMVPNAEKLGGAETPDDDPRITKVGAFLRRFKIDEFPQLLNVLNGEMSLVGPRPEVLEEVKDYTDAELQLLEVRPGITDWASIKFHHEGRITRGSSDPHRVYHEVIRPEKVRLGLQYVEDHTFLIDCRIILRTLLAIFE